MTSRVPPATSETVRPAPVAASAAGPTARAASPHHTRCVLPSRLLPLRLATAAMGTRFEVVLGGENAERLRPCAEAAIAVIEECHRRFSRFAPDSLISHIMRTAHERPVRLDRDTFALFRDALHVHAASAGAFDITVAPWLDVQLGLAVAPMTRVPGSDAILLDEQAVTIRFATRGIAIDLGAIAKGHALDLAARTLRELGISCGLLHGGTSSVIALGAPPGIDGWRIALHGVPAADAIVLRDDALSVSAPAGPRSRPGSGRPGHIVDPRTGQSAGDTRRIAVIGPSARLADAWSTALAVLGRRPETLGEEWHVRWIEA